MKLDAEIVCPPGPIRLDAVTLVTHRPLYVDLERFRLSLCGVDGGLCRRTSRIGLPGSLETGGYPDWKALTVCD